MSQSGRIEIDGLMSREAARALSDRVLKMSAAEQTRVTIVSSQNGNTRFADGSITTSGEADNMSVTVSGPRPDFKRSDLCCIISEPNREIFRRFFRGKMKITPPAISKWLDL